MVGTMNPEQLVLILETCFKDVISKSSAWLAYCNFSDWLHDGDDATMEYFFHVVEMDKKERLRLRTTMSENGHELTPNQLDQYILLLLLALNEYIEQYHL